MSNTFGKIFRLTTFGESHGKAIGGIIDGFPSNIEIDLNFIQEELNKRKSGNSAISSKRKESDNVQILSGIFDNKTLGTPIGFVIPNENQISNDYEEIKNVFRPGHADFTYQFKYGIRDYRGGGRASARETANWVVAGAFAKILLNTFGIEIHAFTSQIGNLKLSKKIDDLDFNQTYKNDSRCPDNDYNSVFVKKITEAKNKKDSIGGIITCVVKNCPIGLGEPVFNKFHAELAKAVMSINACKGFEIGQGFNSTNLTGFEFNDEIVQNDKKISFKTNNSGGVLGGITTGQDIIFNAVFKPTPSIGKTQQTIDKHFNNKNIEIKGRHDPCVVPRAVIVVEAITAMVVADFILMQNIYKL